MSNKALELTQNVLKSVTLPVFTEDRPEYYVNLSFLLCTLTCVILNGLNLMRPRNLNIISFTAGCALIALAIANFYNNRKLSKVKSESTDIEAMPLIKHAHTLRAVSLFASFAVASLVFITTVAETAQVKSNINIACTAIATLVLVSGILLLTSGIASAVQACKYTNTNIAPKQEDPDIKSNDDLSKNLSATYTEQHQPPCEQTEERNTSQANHRKRNG